MPLLDLIRPDAQKESGYERTKESPADDVWWPDPAKRVLPPTADADARGIHTAFAPILHLPPAECIAPIACSRLGQCERHAAGRPCQADHGGAA